jgi:hypothetical protein
MLLAVLLATEIKSGAQSPNASPSNQTTPLFENQPITARPPTAQPNVSLQAGSSTPEATPSAHAKPPNLDALSKAEWQRIDRAVEKALDWLSHQQAADGSFPSLDSGQPAVTSICIMAYLSAGHMPSQGPYGKLLDRAIEYTLRCQRDDGLFSAQAPTMPVDAWSEATHAASYNHAIAGLMLGEVYGSDSPKRSAKTARAIQKAIEFSRQMQIASRRYPLHKGGWRYIRPVPYPGAEQSDLSASSWHIMFYRSAMNAGFDVPVDFMDEATDYVKRSFDRKKKTFVYGIQGHHPFATRAVTGAGLLCLYLSGKSDAEIEIAAGDWMVSHSFLPYNKALNNKDRYHYGAYYCSMAALQLGGDYWSKLYRHLSEVLLDNQKADGTWGPESQDAEFGVPYTTALTVLTLTPPYQLLPIYQR